MGVINSLPMTDGEPRQEHLLDRTCWCDPKVIAKATGDVIYHREIGGQDTDVMEGSE